MNASLATTISLAGLSIASVSSAHHSPAAFDQSREVRLEGTITQYAYSNPHIYITIEMVDANGARVSQRIEVGPISTIQPLGLMRDSLKVGDRVSVRANPRRRGTGTVQGLDLTRADGVVLPLHIAAASARPASTAVATSIAGTWLPLREYFTALNRAVPNFPLTERGRAELTESRRTNMTTHSDCVPAGAPMLMVYTVASRVTVNSGTVVLDVDWLDAQRVVHLDAKHPANLAPSLQGHSIGHWEDGVLVVDTIGFEPHKEGIGFGLGSSAEKHLLERFSLEPDGRHLRYEATVEDPVYLTEPVRHSSLWAFNPDLPFSGVKCDLDVARQYLREDAE